MNNYLTAIDIGDSFFGKGGGIKDVGSISGYVTLFLNASFVIAGVLLLFYFVMGGIGMIAGAGKDNPQQIEKGKQAATSALIGFIIVFTSYWIVKLIESLTGITILGK